MAFDVAAMNRSVATVNPVTGGGSGAKAIARGFTAKLEIIRTDFVDEYPSVGQHRKTIHRQNYPSAGCG